MGNEFWILEKYESILSNDAQYQAYNIEILELEKKILPTLSAEALAMFLKIDALNMKLINHIGIIYSDKITINR